MTSNRTDKKNTKRINQLLVEWSDGNIDVKNEVIQALYPELHSIAHKHFKSKSASTFQTTEIVNEAFIKLNNKNISGWQNKAQFLCFASKVIRSIVVDNYRSKQSQKRGGEQYHMSLERLDTMIESPKGSTHDWFELDQMLNLLAQRDKLAAQVVELKVFGGLTIPEMAKFLKVSESSVVRNWSFARSWLLMQLK